MNFTLTGDLSTGTLNTQSNVISPGDETLTEVSGGSVSSTFEVGEVFDVGLANNYIYRGFFDSGQTSGRLYIFEDVTDSSNFVAFSTVDYTIPALDDNPNDEWPSSIAASSLVTTDLAFCFVQGTFIKCPEGERKIEGLRIGDLITTADGTGVPIKWIGKMQVPFPALMSPKLEPVCISANALGQGAPYQDLYVSSDHGVILDEYVINASALVNDTTICFAPSNEPFTYYHIETEEHESIVANGLPAETFIDAKERTTFDNHRDYIELYGTDQLIQELPLPRIVSNRTLPLAVAKRLGLFDRFTGSAEVAQSA
jgi:hypothetical protein